MLFIAIEMSTTRDRVSVTAHTAIKPSSLAQMAGVLKFWVLTRGEGLGISMAVIWSSELPWAGRAVSCFTLFVFSKVESTLPQGTQEKETGSAKRQRRCCSMYLTDIALLSPRNWEFYFHFACEKVETPAS